MDRINNLYWKAREKSGITWRRSVGRVVDWPPSPGHFVVGNPESAVAVCTLSSTALIDQLDPKQAAIIGRIYTPNLGVEKMITNVVSNPRLRYLVLCGRESPVFRVGDALLKLAENGLDAQGKIIGATGAMAELTNLPTEAVETFRRQIELVNLINEMNPKTINRSVAEYTARYTPAFAAEGLFVQHNSAGDKAIQMPAHRRQWLQLDPSGYFFIQLDREKGELVLEHFTNEKKITHIIRGRAADVLYHTAIAEKLLTQLDHAAYLGAELAKAETALYNNLAYEQDKKLRLSTYADSKVL